MATQANRLISRVRQRVSQAEDWKTEGGRRMEAEEHADFRDVTEGQSGGERVG